MANRKFEIEIKETKGACDNDLFKKMIMRGDIQAKKVADYIDKVVNIYGYAKTHITTDDKDFDMNYYMDDKGLILSSGSEYFMQSVEDYFNDCSTFRIVEVKTKKGKTYKVMPCIVNPKTGNVTDLDAGIDDDLPF